MFGPRLGLQQHLLPGRQMCQKDHRSWLLRLRHTSLLRALHRLWCLTGFGHRYPSSYQSYELPDVAQILPPLRRDESDLLGRLFVLRLPHPDMSMFLLQKARIWVWRRQQGSWGEAPEGARGTEKGRGVGVHESERWNWLQDISQEQVDLEKQMCVMLPLCFRMC